MWYTAGAQRTHLLQGLNNEEFRILNARACARCRMSKACGRSPKTIENSADAPQESQSLVIYSGRSQVLVGGLVEAFEKSTGIKVDVRYEKSTQTLGEPNCD